MFAVGVGVDEIRAGDPDVATGDFGDIPVQQAHQPLGIFGGAGAVVGIDGARIGPRVDEEDLALAGLAAQNHGAECLVVGGQYLDPRRIGDRKRAQGGPQDAVASWHGKSQGVGGGLGARRPIEAVAPCRHFQAAQLREIPLVDQFLHAVAAVVARGVGGKVGNGQAQAAAGGHILDQDLVLRGGAGVPAREDQRLVIRLQEVCGDPVARERDHIRQAIGGAGEMQVLVGRQHRWPGVEDGFDDVPTAFRVALEPVRIGLRHAEGAPYRIGRPEFVHAQIAVALGQRHDGFRLAGGRRVRLYEIVEVGDFLAVLGGGGGPVIDVAEKFARLVDMAIEELLAGMAQARRIADHARRGVHGRIRAKAGLERPVAAFVQDQLGPAQILQVERHLEQGKFERILVRQPRVPFVGQVGSPQGTVELTVKPPRNRGRHQEVTEGEVFGHGNVRAAGDFIIDEEIAAGGHHGAPAGLMPLGHMFGDLAHQIFGQIREGDVSRRFSRRQFLVDDPEGVALAEIITDVQVAERLQLGGDVGGRLGIDARDINALRDGGPGQIQQILIVLPELKRVALVGLEHEIDHVPGRGIVR